MVDCSTEFANGMVPPHVWDGEADPAIPPLNLVPTGCRIGLQGAPRHAEQFLRFWRQQCRRYARPRMVRCAIVLTRSTRC